MADVFQADPFYAIELFTEVLSEGGADEVAVLIRQLSDALSRRLVLGDASSQK
ncbi:hypothetical protein [Pseudomonas syringae]|uniref:hypothetical protein n=1 Tax=Pseudomonas syringae TaxID=317 RepID=UPI002E314592|nr:hypothetical protein [Pseudomonas syringae]